MKISASDGKRSFKNKWVRQVGTKSAQSKFSQGNLSAIFFRINFRAKQWGHERRTSRSCRDSSLKIKLSFIFLIAAIKMRNLCKADFGAGEKFENPRENHNKKFFSSRPSFLSVTGCRLDENICFHGFARKLRRTALQTVSKSTRTSFIHVSKLFCLCPSSSYVKTAWVEWFSQWTSGKTSQLSLSMSSRRRGTKERGASAGKRRKSCYTKKARRKQRRISRSGRVIQFRASSSFLSLLFR